MCVCVSKICFYLHLLSLSQALIATNLNQIGMVAVQQMASNCYRLVYPIDHHSSQYCHVIQQRGHHQRVVKAIPTKISKQVKRYKKNHQSQFQSNSIIIIIYLFMFVIHNAVTYVTTTYLQTVVMNVIHYTDDDHMNAIRQYIIIYWLVLYKS